ncbi:type IV pilus modification protein PilV [compost metagenome]
MEAPRQRGISLIEVLVTIVILLIGLLGLAKLQSRMQVSDVESYQRAQALILLDDMSNRILANSNAAASYVTGASSPLGVGATCTDGASRQQIDSAEWCRALQGAAEVDAASKKLGAVIGGRGCVESVGSDTYLITIAWQGMTPISAPPDSVACGAGLYNGSTACVNDLCRRVVTTMVRVAPL